MGAMKEIDHVLRNTEEHLEAINEKLGCSDSRLMEIEQAIGGVNQRVDQLLHLMQDMIKLEDKIEKLEGKIDGNLTKLTNQLIQMAMVQKGDSTAAVQHQAQSRRDNAFSSPETWEQEQEEEDEWDSPDLDVVEMKH